MNGYYEYVLKGQNIDLIFLSIVLSGRMSVIAFMNPTRCVGLEYERLSAFNPETPPPRIAPHGDGNTGTALRV
jgi:hypothetical protein